MSRHPRPAATASLCCGLVLGLAACSDAPEDGDAAALRAVPAANPHAATPPQVDGQGRLLVWLDGEYDDGPRAEATRIACENGSGGADGCEVREIAQINGEMCWDSPDGHRDCKDQVAGLYFRLCRDANGETRCEWHTIAYDIPGESGGER